MKKFSGFCFLLGLSIVIVTGVAKPKTVTSTVQYATEEKNYPTISPTVHNPTCIKSDMELL